MGVSKNSGTPKWMVYNGNPGIPIKMDDLGVPLFSETPISKFVGMNVKKLSISSKRVVGSKSALSYPLPPKLNSSPLEKLPKPTQ